MEAPKKVIKDHFPKRHSIRVPVSKNPTPIFLRDTEAYVLPLIAEEKPKKRRAVTLSTQILSQSSYKRPTIHSDYRKQTQKHYALIPVRNIISNQIRSDRMRTAQTTGIS